MLESADRGHRSFCLYSSARCDHSFQNTCISESQAMSDLKAAVLNVQAAQRALVVMREKAANEAKSEFMSLMCHEVRTPLNGCLASAGAHTPQPPYFSAHI
jgi:nitrogen-specific signal transduction histidine kinase